MRIVFMGTPDFAVPSLAAIHAAGYEIVGVITQPDRPAGRGNKLTACPVKQKALELGLPVYQFERLRKQEGLDCLRALAPDICVTAAFGQILSQKLLDVPRMGTVNVHASLLPKHRGSAPINRCIQMGDTVTGVTTMLTDRGIDTGHMLLSRETPIGPEETAGELTDRLAKLGAELIVETLEKYIAGEITPVPQNHAEATHEPMMQKDDGRIDWTKSAREIDCHVRGMNPWPGAFTECSMGRMKVFKVRAAEGVSGSAGEVLVSGAKQGLIIGSGDGAVEIVELQMPGANRMPAKAYLQGKTIPLGEKFQ